MVFELQNLKQDRYEKSTDCIYLSNLYQFQIGITDLV